MGEKSVKSDALRILPIRQICEIQGQLQLNVHQMRIKNAMLQNPAAVSEISVRKRLLHVEVKVCDSKI